MKRAFILGVLAVASAGCGGEEKAPLHALPPAHGEVNVTSAPPADPGPAEGKFDPNVFRSAMNESIEAYLVANPVRSTWLGDHRFDDRWPDLTPQGEANLAADFRVRAQGLRTIAASVPDRANPDEAGTDRPAIDAAAFADHLDAWAFEHTALHSMERDPGSVVAVIGSGMTSLTSHDYAPKHTRMDALATRLAAVPALLKTARARVQKPIRAALEVLPLMTAGLGMTLRGTLAKIDVKDLEGDALLKARLSKASLDAATALDAYAAEIAKAFPAAAAKDEPIGSEVWSTLARLHEGVLESPADVRKMGEGEITRLNVELDALIAKSGKPGETRATFFKRMEQDTLPGDKVLGEYRASIQRVNEWLHAHPFATVPWERVKLEVVPSPPERKSTSFASMNASGPLEAKPTDANFEVSVPDAAMPEAKKKALMAFHARGAIDLVTIHEALPGHNLQILAQEHAASKARKIIWASTLGEGWAHYCEQAVVDGGFAGADPLRTHAFYLRMALQRAARVVMDVAENDGSMSVDDAAKFLSQTTFLALEATKMEARRAVISPANMFAYTYGKLRIMQLRDKVKAEEGDKFDLARFHDRLLAFGAIPVRYAGKGAFGLE